MVFSLDPKFIVLLLLCKFHVNSAVNYHHHTEIHQTIINACRNLPFLSLFFKNRCIVQRDGVDCAKITNLITPKFPEFSQMDIKKLEPEFVKHIQRINFFNDFKQSGDFCVISCMHSCPNGFIMHIGKCFLLVKERRNHAEAKKYCAQRNSHLITVECDFTNRFLEDLVIREFHEPVWLGIENDPVENQWFNFNGTHKIEPIYFRWMFFDEGHKHAIMDHGIYNGYWKSAAADEQHVFVCEHRISVIQH